ncbi:MAG: ATP-binding protein [Enterobacterales bacterium]|nr:ATP-binding protein [Enterobacterales bacterium]
MIKLFSPSSWNLKSKFLSILLLILLIPLASIGLLKEIENALFEQLKSSLLLSSKMLAEQLSQNEKWFYDSLLPEKNKSSSKELFVFPLNENFELDGYFEEWVDFEKHRQYFNTKNHSMGLLLGNLERHLFLSIQINDPHLIYKNAQVQGLADGLQIDFETLGLKPKDTQIQSIYLSPTISGNVSVLVKNNHAMKIDWRYKASWIATNNGYSIEIKFPSGIKPQLLKVTHKNVDRERQKNYQSINSSGRYAMNPLVWPSQKIINFSKHLALKKAQRIWILDRQGRVLTSQGKLGLSSTKVSSNPILQWLLAAPAKALIDRRANALHLDSVQIYRAQRGQASTFVERYKNSDQAVAIASYPIKNNGEVLGVLLLEENVAKVQLLQKKALLNMFAVALAIFLLVIFLVYWYVSRMVSRIQHLKSSIDQVVDQQGRMKEPLQIEDLQGDEIDDLYAAFYQMGSRLYDYNDHLEKLASRLSHELRTPIAIVRSSLDNLLISCNDAEDRIIIQRALDGNQRLGDIINRMKQASGVKDAMQTASLEKVNFVQFLTQVISSYQSSFKDYSFKLSINQLDKSQNIAPDLFAEMLDKLISNAMSFCDPSSPIVISAEQKDKLVCLKVINKGPTIDKKNRKRIFHSLVSIRNKQQSTGNNLGLGLYVVKLIAEFHQAKVKVENLQDDSGVAFCILWQQVDCNAKS